MYSRTCISRLGDDLGKELGEVGQVLAEEVGLEHDGFPGVVCVQLATKQFGLAGDAQGGAFLGVLKSKCKLAHPTSNRVKLSTSSKTTTTLTKRDQLNTTCLESKLLQADGETGEGLVSGSGSCDDGEAGDGAVVVSRSNLDAGDICGLV